MSSSCSRCGETKTESVPRGTIYKFLWRRGYSLCRCSFCKRRRLLKRLNPNQPHPVDMTLEELQDRFNREIAKSLGRIHQASEISESKTAKDSPAGSNGLEIKSAVTSGDLAEATTGTDVSNCCPKCGNADYRASRRRWYERLIKRPKMARCTNCHRRFPYPSRPV
jgi:hypothetical protein